MRYFFFPEYMAAPYIVGNALEGGPRRIDKHSKPVVGRHAKFPLCRFVK